MKIKWYISTLIIILAVFGISQERIDVPNQEVLLQFSNVEIDKDAQQSTITIVKQKLETFGANNIQVEDLQNGTLKISYYSSENVANVEAKLSANQKQELEFSDLENDNQQKFPDSKDSNTYNLDVYEIVNGNETPSDLGGKFVFELKQEYIRFYNPNVLLFYAETNKNETSNLFQVAYKINKSVAIAIDNFSYKIPEVRAGPIC